ncbi:MAG: TetR/AcrR family transcriptional regulator [Sphaerochaetaceae bacterium]|jgi:AcrR family transcriptional regulator|nr:TetR/AcrR family transcriptional regulator [Spirochaetaceae bacterium]MDY6344763.1 TetR/AcrR family transcriptional regulator [Sphaerochaetaceae bacterium]
MPKKIDHEARKQEILQAALKVFAREGYRNSNLSLIAAECSLSRPTIYQYFTDKEEIYHYAVKLVTGRMFSKYVSYVWRDPSGEVDKLIRICEDIIDTADANNIEISNLVGVMIQVKHEGRDFEGMIMHRTAKLSILFKRLIRSGMANGVVKSCDVDKVAEQLMVLLEGACLRIAFFKKYDTTQDKDIIRTFLISFKK